MKVRADARPWASPLVVRGVVRRPTAARTGVAAAARDWVARYPRSCASGDRWVDARRPQPKPTAAKAHPARDAQSQRGAAAGTSAAAAAARHAEAVISHATEGAGREHLL